MITSRTALLPRGKWMLAACDGAALAGVFVASAVLRFGVDAGLEYARERGPDAAFVSILFTLSFYVCGLYDTCRQQAPARSVLPAAASIGLALLVAGAYWYARSAPSVGRGIVVEIAFMLFSAVVVTRFLYARAHGALSSRCLIVGSHALAADVKALIQQHPDAPLKIIGLVCDGDPRRPNASAALSPTYPMLGTIEHLDELVAAYRIDRIILPADLRQYPALLRELRPVRYRGVVLLDFVSLYEELAREIPLHHIDDEWLFKAATMSSRIHIRRLKRVIDVASSLLLLVVATPVLAVAALAIKTTSRGPVLFRQERAGLGSKPFMVLKLRTMREDAEKLTGPVWSTDNDPRITSVGRVLRKFRIDELPQLVNVLRGDMSLVGPRPERPMFVSQLADAIPFYSERLLVRPGVTGWAQVMAPYAASVGDSARKLQFDLYYAKNLSFSLDLLIFLKTAKTVLFGRERAQGGMVAGKLLTITPIPGQSDTGVIGAALPLLHAGVITADDSSRLKESPSIPVAQA
jgi:exopolysaccharide biosynthesis polyprenyl glycosylphosphotransferase